MHTTLISSGAPAAASTSSGATAVLFSREALTAHLGLSLRTLDNMVSSGKFPKGVRVGRRLFWTHKVIETWMGRKFGPQQAWRG